MRFFLHRFPPIFITNGGTLKYFYRGKNHQDSWETIFKIFYKVFRTMPKEMSQGVRAKGCNSLLNTFRRILFFSKDPIPYLRWYKTVFFSKEKFTIWIRGLSSFEIKDSMIRCNVFWLTKFSRIFRNETHQNPVPSVFHFKEL